MKTQYITLLLSLGTLPLWGNTLNKNYDLWYDRPGCNRGADFNRIVSRGFPYDKDWEQESLPIGNGAMGACIFGRTDTERIQLSEKTLGNKGPYNFGGFTNFAEIYLDFSHYQVKNYQKKLSLNQAIVTVSYVNPEKPDVPLNKNDAFQKVQKRRVQEKR